MAKAAAKKAAPEKEVAPKVDETPESDAKVDETKNENPSAPQDAEQTNSGDAAPVDANQAESAAAESARRSAAQVAEEIDAGSHEFNSGREREILLVEQGYDPEEVRGEITKARAKRLGYEMPNED